jgi:chromosome segregation ATPase
MAMPALLLELEDTVEERVARLEANVEHVRSDVSDMKVDIRRLGDKIDSVDQKLSAKIDSVDQKLSARIDSVDQKLSAKIDSVDQKLSAKIDSVDQKLSAQIDGVDQNLSTKIDSVVQSIAELRIGRALDRVWWLLMSGALLGILARAFKWI